MSSTFNHTSLNVTHSFPVIQWSHHQLNRMQCLQNMWLDIIRQLHSLSLSLVHSVTHSFTQSFNRSLSQSVTHPPTPSSLTHSPWCASPLPPTSASRTLSPPLLDPRGTAGSEASDTAAPTRGSSLASCDRKPLGRFPVAEVRGDGGGGGEVSRMRSMGTWQKRERTMGGGGRDGVEGEEGGCADMSVCVWGCVWV